MDEPAPTPYDPYYEEFLRQTTDQSPLDPLGGLAALMVGGLIIYLILTAGAVVLGLWIWYTVTWRAVRRGLHEYHHNGYTPKRRKAPNHVPPGWS